MRSHVKQDGEKSVVLAYTEAGGLKQSERYAYGASSAALTLGAERDIAGNTTYFSAQGGGKKLYEQKIEREGATSRITGSTHQWLIGSTKWSHPVEYAYDDRGRLVSAEGAADGSYAYDEYGRFASKHEGASTISGFSYYDNAYRLKSVAGPAGYGSEADFVYDASGNLVMDKGAKQVFVNDARGLPVKIAHYATGVPSSLTVAQVLKDPLPAGADRVGMFIICNRCSRAGQHFTQRHCPNNGSGMLHIPHMMRCGLMKGRLPLFRVIDIVRRLFWLCALWCVVSCTKQPLVLRFCVDFHEDQRLSPVRVHFFKEGIEIDRNGDASDSLVDHAMTFDFLCSAHSCPDSVVIERSGCISLNGYIEIDDKRKNVRMILDQGVVVAKMVGHRKYMPILQFDGLSMNCDK